jgi:hypothetical protein
LWFWIEPSLIFSRNSFLVAILAPIDLSLSWIRKCGVPVYPFHFFVFEFFLPSIFIFRFRRFRDTHHLVIRALVQIRCYLSFYIYFIFCLQKQKKLKKKTNKRDSISTQEREGKKVKKIPRKKKEQKKKIKSFNFYFLSGISWKPSKRKIFSL